MTLTDFLLARIAEDEALLTEYLGPNIQVRRIGESTVVLTDERTGNEQVMSEDSLLDGHLHDAAGRRARRECEAKRRIVEACNEESLDNAFADPTAYRLADEVLRSVALSYADHPDYREEWKP